MRRLRTGIRWPGQGEKSCLNETLVDDHALASPAGVFHAPHSTNDIDQLPEAASSVRERSGRGLPRLRQPVRYGIPRPGAVPAQGMGQRPVPVREGRHSRGDGLRRQAPAGQGDARAGVRRRGAGGPGHRRRGLRQRPGPAAVAGGGRPAVCPGGEGQPARVGRGPPAQGGGPRGCPAGAVLAQDHGSRGEQGADASDRSGNGLGVGRRGHDPHDGNSFRNFSNSSWKAAGSLM